MLSLLLVVPLLNLGQVPNNPELRGAWLFKSGSLNGEPFKFPVRTNYTYVFADKMLIVQRTGAPDRFGVFSIGPGGQTKEIDIRPAGQNEETSVAGVGIFKLEDNGLVLAITADRVNGDIRPADFSAQKGVVVLRFEKMETAHGRKVPRLPNLDEKFASLSGRWELVSGKKPKESVEIAFVRPLFGNAKTLSFRRKVAGSFFGIPTSGDTSVQIHWVDAPDGRKNVIGLVEKVNEQTKEATIRGIPCYFRGDTLELFGEVIHDKWGTINLTGEWQRPDKKVDSMELPNGVFEVTSRTFKMPLEIDEKKTADVEVIRLFVSADRGKTWKRSTQLKLDAKHLFFNAERDDLYWFALQIVTKDGKEEPAEDALAPLMKVYVNTTGKALKFEKSYGELQQEITDLRRTIDRLEKRIGEFEGKRKGK